MNFLFCFAPFEETQIRPLFDSICQPLGQHRPMEEMHTHKKGTAPTAGAKTKRTKKHNNNYKNTKKNALDSLSSSSRQMTRPKRRRKFL